MKNYQVFFFLVVCLVSCSKKNSLEKESAVIHVDLTTKFEWDSNRTATYEEGIQYWQGMDDYFPEIQLIEVGETDSGKPLHAVLFTEQGIDNIDQLKKSSKPLLFINNAIHAGEPCGVDATMMLLRDILMDDNRSNIIHKIDVIAIPFYNVGGVLNRNSTTRTNQNGPQEYGFRGNAKNLDLNRDFIKADSKNAQSFNRLFAQLSPEVFIDTHTSNGADYQHIMTLISTMPEHYEEPLRSLYTESLVPFLFSEMKDRSSTIVPYVDMLGETPFEGLFQFNDVPRYSSGYASLFNTLSFTSEAHMLKTYEQRVWGTYALLDLLMFWTANHSTEISEAINAARKRFEEKNEYTLQWTLDKEQWSKIEFLGYQAEYKPSLVTGKKRLFYNHEKKITDTIRFYNSHKPSLSIEKPTAYIIPQAYTGVIERLKWNQIDIEILKEDEVIDVQAYRIMDYESKNKPYENHFLHSRVKVNKIPLTKQFYAGDIRVNLNQPNAKYILETLEPQAIDSFFAWNFFDGVLMQKEYFSPYIFEDEAAELLKKNPTWRKELEQKRKENTQFANSTWEQLYFVYKKSNRYEPTHNVYPVYRIE